MATIHFLKVGCADATVITTDAATFLVDCENIGDHAKLLPASKRLRGVFVTHQHRDHFSGLQYLKDKNYVIDHLVYSPYERRRGDNSVQLDEWTEFDTLRAYFESRGTKTHAPFRQGNLGEAPWWKTENGVDFEIIGPHRHIATRETRELHDACLVIKAVFPGRACLFAGDASNTSLAEIASTTNNYCNGILHVSHHGSINGAEDEFIKKANAKYSVISTAEGVHDSVPHPDALRLYKRHTSDGVYRTDESSGWWKFNV